MLIFKAGFIAPPTVIEAGASQIVRSESQVAKISTTLSGNKRPFVPTADDALPAKNPKLIDTLQNDKETGHLLRSNREIRVMTMVREALDDPLAESSQEKMNIFKKYMDSQGQSKSQFAKEKLLIFESRKALAADSSTRWAATRAFLRPTNPDAAQITSNWIKKMNAAGMDAKIVKEYQEVAGLNAKYMRLYGALKGRTQVRRALLTPWEEGSQSLLKGLSEKDHFSPQEIKMIQDQASLNTRIYQELAGSLQTSAYAKKFFDFGHPFGHSLTKDELIALVSKLSPKVSKSEIVSSINDNKVAFAKWQRDYKQGQMLKAILSPLSPESRQVIQESLALSRNGQSYLPFKDIERVYNMNLQVSREERRLAELAAQNRLS